jgi:hypothetical protein
MHWETRAEVVKVAVPRRQVVPVTTTIKVPMTTERVVEQDVVVSRTIVGGTPTTDPFAGQTQVAGASQQIGGIARLDRDPPRRGSAEVDRAGGSRLAGGASSGRSSVTADSQWRPASPSRR